LYSQAANILRVQYPLGLGIDCLALFLDYIVRLYFSAWEQRTGCSYFVLLVSQMLPWGPTDLEQLNVLDPFPAIVSVIPFGVITMNPSGSSSATTKQ